MSVPETRHAQRIKQTRFPVSLFFVLFGVLLLMSGIHTGFVVLVNALGWNQWVQTAVPVGYWALVAYGLTRYTKWRMKKTYDEPMQALACATAKVANGDFSVYVSPYHTADKLDYLDVMLTDFNKMVAELGSIETLKTDFFSNVSHEIKTPLAIIQSNAELLGRKALPDAERMESAQTIVDATRRLSGLITNMLKLNKLEKQAIRPMAQAYNLCAQLSACAIGFEAQWEKKNIEFVAEIEDTAMIDADESLMELVWNNLLSNAIKFTPPGGTVTLRQSTSGHEIIVEIADTGCGMSEETLRRMFEKFYQGDTSHATEGNGLGLALVLRILELTGGSVSAKSAPGEGAIFTVTVPTAQGDGADE